MTGIVVLATVGWEKVSPYFDSSSPYFATEPSAHIDSNPLIVFLGIDERSSPNSTNTSSSDGRTQQSLPKESDESLAPTGNPYYVIDTTHHPELAKKALEAHGGDNQALFMDLRAESLCMDFESTGVVAEARTLVDWNKRSRHHVSKMSPSAQKCS